MKLRRFITFLSVTAVAVSLAVVTVVAQKGKNYTVKYQYQFDDVKVPLEVAAEGAAAKSTKAKGATLIRYQHPLPQVKQAASTDWRLNGGDLANSRFSSLNQINTENIGQLAVRWMQQITAGGQADFGPRHETTPIIVNGVMYVTDMDANVFALDAVTGQRIWEFILPEVSRIRRVTNRGVVYGDGKVYVAAGGRVFALDALTGEPIESFGGADGVPVVANALQDRFPGLSPDDTASLGYDSTIAPQFYRGMVFITYNHSENNIPGGLVIAMDATTGQVIWKWNTVPQDANDDGWDIAGPTWVGGVRNGGGVWNTPAIDPGLGAIYFAVGNPTPDLDGSARKGMNLFTNSIVALDLMTGKLRWFFQEVHHDIWDFDSSAPVVLFDTQIGGQPVKGIGEANKGGFTFFLNRETGEPLHGVEELPVDTATDVPGEEVFPTQPIPLRADGNYMEAYVPLTPVDVPEGFEDQVEPFRTPYSVNRFIIEAPALHGGSLYSHPGFSPRTGLVYIPAMDRLNSLQSLSLGATLMPGDSSFGGRFVGPPREERGTLTAFDPATGNLIWQASLPGQAQAGLLVTGGNLVFQGTGFGIFHGFNAATGQELFQFFTGNRIQAAPVTYEVNGVQYITVAAGDTILTFALLGQ